MMGALVIMGIGIERSQFFRKYTRYQYGTGDVSSAFLTGQFGDAINARVIDLSVGGAKLLVNGFKVFNGEKIGIELALPGRTSSKSYHGKIVWIRDAVSNAMNGLFVGIKFTEMDSRLHRDLSLVFQSLRNSKNSQIRKRLIPPKQATYSNEWLILATVVVALFLIYSNPEKFKLQKQFRDPAFVSEVEAAAAKNELANNPSKEKSAYEKFWEIIYKYVRVQ